MCFARCADYDIADREARRWVDAPGVRRAGNILTAFIGREWQRGIPSQRIVLAGISRGGATALHTGVRHARPLAAMLAISCCLPLHQETAVGAYADNRSMPTLTAHGSQDRVIPFAQSENSRASSRTLGYVVETHTYPMPHAVFTEEVRDIADWLRRELG